MWHRRAPNFRIIYNVTNRLCRIPQQFAELECCQVTPDTSGNPIGFQWGSRKYPGNTDRDEIVGGNDYVYMWISMLTEICSSGFERLTVYKFSHSVDQASVCFVHKVYKFLHARVYPVISWQQFSTIGIIQWANKHEMEFVLNFYVANLIYADRFGSGDSGYADGMRVLPIYAGNLFAIVVPAYIVTTQTHGGMLSVGTTHTYYIYLYQM